MKMHIKVLAFVLVLLILCLSNTIIFAHEFYLNVTYDSCIVSTSWNGSYNQATLIFYDKNNLPVTQ